MRRLTWILLAALLLLTSCGEQEARVEESDSYPEPYHLREPVDEAMMPRVEGIKACFDVWKETDGFPLTGGDHFYIEHRSSASDPGQIPERSVRGRQGRHELLLRTGERRGHSGPDRWGGKSGIRRAA